MTDHLRWKIELMRAADNIVEIPVLDGEDLTGPVEWVQVAPQRPGQASQPTPSFPQSFNLFCRGFALGTLFCVTAGVVVCAMLWFAGER